MSFKLKPAFFILYLVLTFAYLQVSSQCLTDFGTILPDTTLATLQEYGSSVAIYEDYVAIGSPANDSIKYNGGVVFIYKKAVNHYEKVATVFPKGSDHYSRFGYAIDLNNDYLVVTAPGDNTSLEEGAKPRLYIFKKPTEGWKDNTEAVTISGYGGNLFGVQVHIADDSKNILVGNLNVADGSVYSFKKGPLGWESGVSYQEIKVDPKYLLETRNIDFGETLIAHDDYLAVGARFSYYNERYGGIFVFKDVAGDGLNYAPIAILQGKEEESYFLGQIRMAMDAQFIYSSVYEDGNVFFIAYPKEAEWQDDNKAIQIPFSSDTMFVTVRGMAAIENDIFVTALFKDDTENIFIFNRDSIGNKSYYPKRIITKQGAKNSGFGIDIDAHDSELIIGNHRSADFNYSNGVTELFDASSDTVIQKEIFTETFYDASDHYFGNNLYYANNHLLVGAPNDSENGTEYGAVYIYKRSGDGWQKEGKVVPPGKDRYDDFFGSAIAHSGEDFAIGAPGFEPGGKVFLYKNSAPSGINLVPYAIIEPPDTMKVSLFGSSVAIENDLLAVSGHDQDGTVKNVLFIYERDADAAWILRDVLRLSNVSPLAKGRYLSIDIYDQQILLGNSSSGAAGFIGGAGELLTKDLETGHWKITARFTQPKPASFNGFGTLAKITENHIFISAPNVDIAGIKSVGAIYVYTKPANGWAGYTSEARQIVPYDSLGYGLFGYSFEVIQNTLIVGAPLADYKLENSKTVLIEDPGAVYVIQGVDYFWQETIPFLKLQGTSLSESDQYGFSVALSEDHFFIGATMEDTEKGHNSGAVYATKMPPLVKIAPPLCLSDEPVDLFGYPYGGVWAGSGITDADLGIFDPKIAGIGEHMLTYETPNCAYTGKLKIVVNPSPSIKATSPLKTVLCTDVSVELSVEASDATAFQWFFKAEDEDTFRPVNESNAAVWKSSEPGSYYCEVVGNWCAVNSPVFVVEKMQYDIEIITDSKFICQGASVQITTNAPSEAKGHIWYFKNPENKDFIEIEDDKVLMTSKPGDYMCQVFVGSCSFYSDTVSMVGKSLSIAIETPEVACNSDQQIRLRGMPEGGVWSGVGIADPIKGVFDPGGLKNGSYSITYTVEDDDCSYSVTSNVLVDVGAPLMLRYTDEEVCLSQYPTLEVENGEQYEALEWYFSEGVEAKLIASNVSEIEIRDFGTYYTVGKLHSCRSFSDTVELRPKPDEIFIPNVFTPNGDPFNEDFQIIGENMEEFYLKITNRWGKIVFESRQKDHKWRADNCPSGVYFYAINYKDCFNKNQLLTGTLTVIK